ncbi:MAG TPA: hypothetical protein PKC78_08065 [Accumulibacter sp.]|uniref:hypothetical protein n=1 Tax=Accumulibacter sp. TaxID=2053492 RepID=UPI002C81132C|nr:hypothetical protein [Accumulibacter sp.]HMW80309.1 hypothetical protein [Accumulibacter sp.]HMY98017.1 hypothetical protein [Burkholderiaceae bacterium]HNG77994.1 hypothetical protein [Burkholderiaceae bacterium]
MSDERFQFLYDFQVNDQKLDRTAKLIDQLNLGLERSTRALRGFETASGSFNRIGDGAKAATSKVLDLAAALNVAGTVARAVGGGVSAVYGGLDRFGDSFIKAAGERTSTVRGYTTFLDGDKRQAELEYYRAQQFAQKTDFTSQTIEQGQSRLLAQGFRGHDLYATLFAASDLAAASPDDKNETLKRLVKGFTDVKAKGHLQGEELTTQFAEAGLNLVLVEEELRKSLGLKNIGAVDKAISSGSVSADVALPAIQRAILAQLHTTKAGEFATSSAGSLTSLLSNRDEAFQNLSKAFDADQALPAIGRYKKALTEETALYDVNGKKGKDLALVLQDIANATTNAKAGLSELTAAFTDSFSESYAQQQRRDGRDFSTEFTTGALRNLGEAIGRLGSIASVAVGSTNGLVANVAQRAANVVNHDTDLFSALDQGKYGTAAKLAAEGLANRVPGLSLLKYLPEPLVGRYIYNRTHGDLLLGDTDESLANATSQQTQDNAANRANLSAGKYRFTASDIFKAERRAADAADKKAKKARGFDELLTNYESPAFQGKGIGGSATGVDAIGSVVDNALSSGRSDQRAIIVNQQVNITVPSSEIAQRLAGELRNARDSIADELRTLSRAPRAAARR